MEHTRACSAPALQLLVASYCLGLIPSRRKVAEMEAHIIGCDACLQAAGRVERQIRLWQQEGIADQTLAARMPELPKRFYRKRE